MNRPIITALAAFTLWVGTTVHVSDFKQRKVARSFEIASGLLFAVGA